MSGRSDRAGLYAGAKRRRPACGAPGETRTLNLWVRSPVLCPIELRARVGRRRSGVQYRRSLCPAKSMSGPLRRQSRGAGRDQSGPVKTEAAAWWGAAAGRVCRVWGERRDSNPRSSGPQPDALSLYATPTTRLFKVHRDNGPVNQRAIWPEVGQATGVRGGALPCDRRTARALLPCSPVPAPRRAGDHRHAGFSQDTRKPAVKPGS